MIRFLADFHRKLVFYLIIWRPKDIAVFMGHRISRGQVELTLDRGRRPGRRSRGGSTLVKFRHLHG